MTNKAAAECLLDVENFLRNSLNCEDLLGFLGYLSRLPNNSSNRCTTCSNPTKVSPPRRPRVHFTPFTLHRRVEIRDISRCFHFAHMLLRRRRPCLPLHTGHNQLNRVDDDDHKA